MPEGTEVMQLEHCYQIYGQLEQFMPSTDSSYNKNFCKEHSLVIHWERHGLQIPQICFSYKSNIGTLYFFSEANAIRCENVMSPNSSVVSISFHQPLRSQRCRSVEQLRHLFLSPRRLCSFLVWDYVFVILVVKEKFPGSEIVQDKSLLCISQIVFHVGDWDFLR